MNMKMFHIGNIFWYGLSTNVNAYLTLPEMACGTGRDAGVSVGDHKAHMAFVGPPYNMVIDGNVSGKGAIKHGDFAMASGEMSEAEFTNFLTECPGLLARNSKSGSAHFVCMDWRHIEELMSAGNKVYDSLRNLCVWAKDNGGQGSFYRSRRRPSPKSCRLYIKEEIEDAGRWSFGEAHLSGVV
jgi:hypothetical protein